MMRRADRTRRSGIWMLNVFHCGPLGRTHASEKMTGTRPMHIASNIRMLEGAMPRGQRMNLLRRAGSMYLRQKASRWSSLPAHMTAWLSREVSTKWPRGSSNWASAPPHRMRVNIAHEAVEKIAIALRLKMDQGIDQATGIKNRADPIRQIPEPFQARVKTRKKRQVPGNPCRTGNISRENAGRRDAGARFHKNGPTSISTNRMMSASAGSSTSW